MHLKELGTLHSLPSRAFLISRGAPSILYPSREAKPFTRQHLPHAHFPP